MSSCEVDVTSVIGMAVGGRIQRGSNQSPRAYVVFLDSRARDLRCLQYRSAARSPVFCFAGGDAIACSGGPFSEQDRLSLPTSCVGLANSETRAHIVKLHPLRYTLKARPFILLFISHVGLLLAGAEFLVVQ